MFNKRNLLLGLFIPAIFLILSTPAAQGARTINIGVIGAMKFDYGQELWNGATMAADEINKRGGVRVGRKRMNIRLIKANSNEFLNVAYATNTMEMLFFRNNVDFVVGGFRSEAVMAMQDVAMDHRKIFISIGAALPQLCQRVAQNYNRYKYYFRGGTINTKYLGKACFMQLSHVADLMRAKLNKRTIKVAIVAEKTSWVEEIITASQKNFPKMGLELTDVLRISQFATDVTSVIKTIGKSKEPIVFTLLSSNAGIAFVNQVAENNLPVAMVGINVEAQKGDFWKLTEGKAEYVMTTSAFCKGVEITKLTKNFVQNYLKRYGKLPTYNAGTYTAIANTLVPAIEQAGTLDPDILVRVIENRKYETPYGLYAYEKDELGRPLHDIKFGAEYAMLLGVQWQNGKLKGVWPNKYVDKPGAKPLTYEGIKNYKIPPIVISEYQH